MSESNPITFETLKRAFLALCVAKGVEAGKRVVEELQISGKLTNASQSSIRRCWPRCRRLRSSLERDCSHDCSD